MCFFIWYVAGDILLSPIETIAPALLNVVFPGAIEASELNQGSILFHTNYPYRSQDGRIGSASFSINALIYAYNLPVIAALSLAVSKWKSIAARLAIVYGLLLPVWLWGVVFDYIKTVAIALGPEVSATIGISKPVMEVVGLSYQFGYLMLPSISIPLIWLTVCRRDFPVFSAAFGNFPCESRKIPAGSNHGLVITKDNTNQRKFKQRRNG